MSIRLRRTGKGDFACEKSIEGVSHLSWWVGGSLAWSQSRFPLGPEPGGLLRTARGISLTVGMGARTGELSSLDNEVLVPDWSTVKPTFQDLPNSGSIAGLG